MPGERGQVCEKQHGAVDLYKGNVHQSRLIVGAVSGFNETSGRRAGRAFKGVRCGAEWIQHVKHTNEQKQALLSVRCGQGRECEKCAVKAW